MKDPVALNLNMIVTIVDGGMGYEVIKFSKTAEQLEVRYSMGVDQGFMILVIF